MNTTLIYSAAWPGLAIPAIAVGDILEKVCGSRMDMLTARQLSTVVGVLFFAAYVWTLTGVFRIESSNRSVVIGGLWLFMKVAFEFGFDRYVMRHPWDRLLRDYKILEGRLWVFLRIPNPLHDNGFRAGGKKQASQARPPDKTLF